MTERSALSVPELESLRELASSVREHAYAPYSKYRVGAALRSVGGQLFSGCNVENASYGATLCAERAAVAAMVAAGEGRLDAIVIFTDEGPPGMPCGICRQTLLEFADPECLVIAVSPRETKRTTLGALVPEPFVLTR
jgi:cytidine deaminase